jgi:two-component system response regulator FixJ
MTSVIHIVDDEESVRNSLAFLLEIAGFATRTYDGAAALLACVGSLEEGCLVTDLRMPGINGVELLRRLRAMGSTIPAIVVTGHGDVQMAVEAIRQGAFDFIEKPFSEGTIVDAIRRAMDATAHAAERERSLRAREIVESLDQRELGVLRGVVDGLPNKLIAETLGIGLPAVEEHRAELMDRIGAGSLPELVRLTMDLELLRGPGGH